LRLSRFRPAGLRDGSRFFPELESLRGIAIVLVVLYHAEGILRLETTGHVAGSVNPLNAYVFAGHTGVTLFFVLSAFLLSQPFWRQLEGGRRVSVRDFGRRRALRILPLYTLAVVIATVASATSWQDLSKGVPALLFDPRFNGLSLFPYSVVWWSLRTEVQFYLLLPLMPLALGTASGRRIALTLLVSWLIIYAALALHWIDIPRYADYRIPMQSVLGRAPAFLFGIGAAWVYRIHGSRIKLAAARSRWLTAAGADVLLWVLLLLLGSILAKVAEMGVFKAELRYHYWHVAEAMIWSLLVLILLLLPLRSKRLFSNPVLDGLGVISYSVYLLHFPILFFCIYPLRLAYPNLFSTWSFISVVSTAALLLAIVFLSGLSYRFIEQPFLSLKRRPAA